MDKVWFIKVEKEPEGPFSVEELRWDPRITPETLAWREGMSAWLPIRQIPELASLFVQEEPSGRGKKREGGEKVLTLNPDPQPLYYVFLIAALFALLLVYFLYL